MTTPQSRFTLAELITGLEATIKGDPNCIIEGVCTIDNSQPGHIAFLMNSLYKKCLPETKAAAVILTADEAKNCPVNAIICRDPYYTYAKIASFFEQKPKPALGIHPSAVVGNGCDIDSSVCIGANAVIGNDVKLASHVVIGAGTVIGDGTTIDEHTVLDANVTVYYNVKIGKRTHIYSGVVIGADGFGNAKHKGIWHTVPQLGSVEIGDDVTVGANTTIDRGAIENTVIENGVRLDNLIQVGHNVRIGEQTAIAGCVGIAGSATIGKNCLVGGQSGFGGHITVADNVMITGGTEVSKSIREPGVYSSGIGGVVTNQEWRKNSARVLRLEQLVQRVKNLEAVLEALTERKET